MSAHAGDERLGPYCLREQLGEGGMGVVYLASDAAERPVAIKVLRHGVATDQTARRRLAHEVETMRRVSSPHVAEVVDADLTGSPPYIVTRYVPGKTLEDIVAAEGPLTGPALARLAAGLTSALSAVHAAGVVHRDLKPGNVLLVNGQPVVIDFGIAQAADSTRLTMTGMFMGTPGYLAPEVIEGRPSGPAADIHSWGATMAYAATGRPPFGSGTFEAIFYRIVHGQPDLTGMPAPLVPLVLTALARDPARRPSAAELTDAVARLNPSELAASANGHRPAVAAAAAAPGTMPDLSLSQVRTRSAELAGAAGAAVAGAAIAGAAAAGAAPVALSAVPPAPSPPPALMPHGGALPQAWPGTRPLAMRERGDFADLLPPVNYAAAAPAAPFAGPAGFAAPGPVPAPGRPPGPRGQSAAGAGAARVPLVLATVAGLIAASVLLPIAGAAAVLIVLILLRSVDVVTVRRTSRGTGAAAAAAYFPWAVLRSVVRFILLAPLAVLCAAGAAAIGVLASGSSSLPKAGAWAAGALVACYCLGPGSAPCRRPLSRLYGRMSSSAFGAVAGFAGLAALAGVAVIAAVALTPGYWPASHLGQQLQSAALHHSFLQQWPGSLTRVSKQIIAWVGQRL
jgi:predicted Ser/Thr protein kinase